MNFALFFYFVLFYLSLCPIVVAVQGYTDLMYAYRPGFMEIISYSTEKKKKPVENILN